MERGGFMPKRIFLIAVVGLLSALPFLGCARKCVCPAATQTIQPLAEEAAPQAQPQATVPQGKPRYIK
jgi:hypothetical protein